MAFDLLILVKINILLKLVYDVLQCGKGAYRVGNCYPEEGRSALHRNVSNYFRDYVRSCNGTPRFQFFPL